MNYQYSVEILKLEEIHELPGAWTQSDFVALLNRLDYDDVESIPSEELKEMAAMALTDLEPEEAAVSVLELRLGDKLSSGQRQNISEELKDERLWEEYAEISMHEELFNVSCMLFWAFPRVFPEPDVVGIELKVTAMNTASETNLTKLTPSFLARLLNDGMDDHNAIYRLFDDKMASNSFPESEDIIWKFNETGYNASEKSNTIAVFTSWNWVDELRGVETFGSTAWADG